SDKGKQMRSAYRFDLATKQFDTTALFSISTAEVKKLAKDSDAKFDPSAAAIHPINKRLYILSSAGNLLVIADNKGTPIEVYNLNPDQHPQAEGIAFAPNGDMFISNEGKYGKPSLHVFHYQNGKKN
ncbi:MAG TPA: SdiA-regulated domain-containing protein, partial [Flavisolibacter sp.]|nr:SdiA-regulated domain-containing protein [Flavisolibacter sp.]